jgi:hypothetical protein
MDVKDVKYKGVEWIHLAQNRVSLHAVVHKKTTRPYFLTS